MSKTPASHLNGHALFGKPLARALRTSLARVEVDASPLGGAVFRIVWKVD